MSELGKRSKGRMLENDLSRKEAARNGSDEELKRFDFSRIFGEASIFQQTCPLPLKGLFTLLSSPYLKNGISS